uniref:Uncharacterized protein n=1 Tax=Candidatus Kentrum sp. FM TaxID=2126340 RepID=A0A450SFA2_9GAMM|nr:MAG: hypothetical protein BECKFM1743C_GA0114222_100978 [Candidatus Kentron sp. FM]VFJ54298.1 MAG: hypothetical protein BECKFM1743A_GA0114220_101295 [Candidatus Kentron sp. FM]VFK08396.1 MAG: hypothetical protein BECKFM1743B_GA0114221_1006810 [Candidatus Kentron sp. FM]
MLTTGQFERSLRWERRRLACSLEIAVNSRLEGGSPRENRRVWEQHNAHVEGLITPGWKISRFASGQGFLAALEMTCFLSSRSEARDLVTLFTMCFHSKETGRC